MTEATSFARFGKRFAASGTAAEPTDNQADAGLAFLGANPPTFGLHNALWQWGDDKDNWLFRQIAQIMQAGGQTPSASSGPGDTLAAMRSVFGAALTVVTSTRNITVPVGKTQALVFLWAGGGAGGGSFGSGSAASGGGAGEFRLGIVGGLTDGQSLPVTIGLGGAGGSSGSSPGNGGAGGISSFAGVMGCVGGGGGFSATNALQITNSGAAGTGGSGGSLAISGTTGGLAQTAGSGVGGGSGGSTFMTSIPQPNLGVSVGTNGNFPAGGGNGGSTGGQGGPGANGLCICLFI